MEIFGTIIGSSIVTTILLSLIILVSKTWIVEKIKLSLYKEGSTFSEELQWESKVRERAEKVAEYLSFVNNLKESTMEEGYIKANKLSWELAMWLPDNIYKEMVKAVTNPDKGTNVLSVVISVRKLLLKDSAGDLNQDDVAFHAPGIGRNNKKGA